MPHTIEIDTAGRVARVHISGVVDGAEVMAAVQEVYSRPEWEHGFSTLWDTLGITALVLSPEDLEAFEGMAEEVFARRGPGRTAFVAVHPDVELSVLIFGMKSLAAETRTFRVFEDIASAEAWLAKG